MAQTLLLTVTLKGKTILQHASRGRRVLIGRQPDSDVLLDNPAISRAHAEVTYEQDGRYYVTDLGSSNGLLLNGKKSSREWLRNGDQLSIGKFELHVGLLDDRRDDSSTSLASRDMTIRVPDADGSERRGS